MIDVSLGRRVAKRALYASGSCCFALILQSGAAFAETAAAPFEPLAF